MKAILRKAGSFCGRVGRTFSTRVAPALALGAMGTAQLMAEDPTITPPVDVGPYITAGAVVLGTVWATAIGVWVGFIVTKRAVSAVSKALKT